MVKRHCNRRDVDLLQGPWRLCVDAADDVRKILAVLADNPFDSFRLQRVQQDFVSVDPCVRDPARGHKTRIVEHRRTRQSAKYLHLQACLGDQWVVDHLRAVGHVEHMQEAEPLPVCDAVKSRARRGDHEITPIGQTYFE